MIRALTAGDEATLQELCRLFKERIPTDDEATRLLAADDVHVWVAEDDGRLAGFAYAYVLLRIDGDTSVFLYELGVDERFRRRGHGRSLIDEARALAERIGAVKMWVQTEPENAAAQRTYEAAGGTRSQQPDILFSWSFR